METFHMSTIDIILTRMMYEAVFADAVFENAEAALMEYNLLPEEVSRFKTISRLKLSAMTLEDRKTFAAWVTHPHAAPNPLSGTDDGA
jgi:hypothetical protein